VTAQDKVRDLILQAFAEFETRAAIAEWGAAGDLTWLDRSARPASRSSLLHGHPNTQPRGLDSCNEGPVVVKVRSAPQRDLGPLHLQRRHSRMPGVYILYHRQRDKAGHRTTSVTFTDSPRLARLVSPRHHQPSEPCRHWAATAQVPQSQQ